MWTLAQISFECCNAKAGLLSTLEIWASTPALPTAACAVLINIQADT